MRTKHNKLARKHITQLYSQRAIALPCAERTLLLASGRGICHCVGNAALQLLFLRLALLTGRTVELVESMRIFARVAPSRRKVVACCTQALPDRMRFDFCSGG